MLREYRTIRVSSAVARIKDLRSIFYAALILALGIVSLGVAPAARAAPAQSDVTYQFFLGVYPPLDPICVGHDYKVIVRPKLGGAFTTDEGRHGELDTRFLSGIRVESSVSDSSIATLSPRYMISGDPELENPGEATFSLHAVKAGTTSLIFEATIPAGFGAVNGYVGPVTSIKVVNCAYRVNMLYQQSVSMPGGRFFAYGLMTTKIAGDGQEFKGSGTFNINSSLSAYCKGSYSVLQVPTNITGKITADDQLELSFQYQPGSVRISVSCPGAGGAGSGNPDASLAIQSASLPARGGTRSYTNPDGSSMVVSVVPLSESGQ